MPRAASTPAVRWPRRGRTCSAPGSSASSPRTSRSDRGRPPAPRAREDVRFIDKVRARQTIEAHRDLIRGVKVRLSRQQVGANAAVALATALETAAAARLPLMVHVGDTPIPLDDILRELRPGDVLTHCFHGREEGVLDAHGRVRAEARRAVERGVTFDVGHGVGSFSFAVARSALAQELKPGTISSDLHVYNLPGPVFDLATTMS